MAALRPFALGRLTGSFTLTPLSIAADGTISAGTSRSVTGQMKTCRFAQENEMENLVPTPSRQKNEIILEGGSEIEFGGVLFANDSPGAPTNWVQNIVQTNDYCLLSWVQGGLGISKYGIVRNYETNIEGKGGIPFRLVLGPIDASGADVAFS